jgi:putative ABC transport system permease protein
MTLWSRFRSWLQAVLQRSRMETEMDAEFRFHVEAYAEDLVRSGVPRPEAMRRARLEFGGIERAKEECRDARGVNHLEALLQDLRFGARMLHKSPGFTMVAVIILALGIGASTAVFSIVDAVLLRALPYKDAERLVTVWCTEIGQPGTKIFASYRDFEEFKAHNHSFEELAALTWARVGEILTWRGSPHEVLVIPASAEFFPLLGISAAQGRTFGPEDIQNGCTVVLAHSFWQTELAAATGIVGSTLTLSGKSCAVVGVMPRSFEFYPKQTSLWTLITPESKFSKEPFDSVVGIFGRLKPAASIATAETELVELHQRVVKESPAGSWVAQIAPIVRDLREQFTWMAGRNLRIALLVLFAAVEFLLLIACLNVANLLLGRSAERHKELAVRAALGSGRSRLVRQLFTETMLLAALGTLFGILFAVGAVGYFNSANLVELPPGAHVTINLHVLGFAIFLTSATGSLFGLLPAWRGSRVDLNEVLKQSGRSVIHAGARRASQLLVVGQVALSMILLAGAGLLIESIVRLASVPLGFRSDHLLTAQVALPPEAYSKLNQRANLYEKLVAKLSVLPGVEGVALCSALPPYNGGGSSELAVAGKAPIENLQAVDAVQITSDYFRVLGVPFLQGRQFDSRDREGSQPVAIVNDQMVRRYFPKEDPIGKQIKLSKFDDKIPWLTIIGVVGNEKRTVVYQEMGYVEPALVYRPVSQAAGTSIAVVMRTAGDPMALGRLLQGEMSGLDGNVPVYDVRTMMQRYSEFLAHPRFRAILMGILAGLTFLLAAIGIYGVLAQVVSQRTQEIGIRLTLGAMPSQVFGLVLGQGMGMVGIGVVIGTMGALGLTRLISTMLYGVGPTDLFVFIAVTVSLISVALLACYVPARRAMRVPPMVALRYE